MYFVRIVYEDGKSLPTRGEWIEISRVESTALLRLGLSPHGESGLKWLPVQSSTIPLSLSPHGESGLKYHLRESGSLEQESLPTRGEWIEMH